MARTPFLLCWIAALLAGAASLPARTFTSSDGKTLEGSLVRVTEAGAVIKLDSGGREVVVPLARLHEDDQAFVKKWHASNPDLNFELTAVKTRVDRRSSNEGGRRHTAEDWRYEITIQSRSRDPLTDLVLHYSQFVLFDDKNSSKGGISRHGTGTIAVPPIPPSGRVVVRTQPVLVESLDSRVKSGNLITTEKWNETLRGMNVEAYWGHRPVMRWNTGSSERLGIVLKDDEKRAARIEALTLRPLLSANAETPVEWRYQTTPPGDGWEKPGFNDAAWAKGFAPFRTSGKEDAKEEGPTAWKSEQIWIRRAFNISPGAALKELIVQTTVDDIAEIFINGHRITRVGSPANRDTKSVPPEVLATLDPAKPSIIAVRGRNAGGGSYLNVQLFEKREVPAFLGRDDK